MAREKLLVDKSELQEVIDRLENSQVFKNLGMLWKAVAATTWALCQKPRPVTAAIAYQKAKQYGIVTKTKPGRKGPGGTMTEEHKAAMLAGRGQRVPRSEKMKEFSDTFESLRKNSGERWSNLVEKAEKGSFKAAIALKCLDCACWQITEIRDCTCVACPLFPHRPYKNRENEEEIEEIE